ncbi:MAG: hypothetical protein AAGA48_24970 [Myxococcota bacterium]
MLTLFLAAITASPAQADDAGTATIEFHTARPNIKIARVTGRGLRTQGSRTDVASFYEDLCVAPCAAQVTPGYEKLVTFGKGRVPSTFSYSFQDGTTVLDVRTGSSALRHTGIWAQVLGWSSVVVGGFLFVADASTDPEDRIDPSGVLKASMVGGGAVVGLGGLALTRNSKGKWTVRSAP